MTNADQMLAGRLAECPLVAIIRGVTPAEAEGIGAAIVEAGIRIVEVPLNSPEPLLSIERLANALGDSTLVGAGTVLDPADVGRVRDSGGCLIVSPNTHPPVIEAVAAAGLVSLPGFFTPSEAFAALRAGATGLKLFPAEGASPEVVKAMRAVLPKGVPLLVVGGVAYTLGALAYAFKRPNPVPGVFAYHEVFHGLTLVAAVLHFAAVLSMMRGAA